MLTTIMKRKIKGKAIERPLNRMKCRTHLQKKKTNDGNHPSRFSVDTYESNWACKHPHPIIKYKKNEIRRRRRRRRGWEVGLSNKLMGRKTPAWEREARGSSSTTWAFRQSILYWNHRMNGSTTNPGFLILLIHDCSSRGEL